MGPAQMMQTLFHHGDETDSFTEYNLASEIPFVSPAATFCRWEWSAALRSHPPGRSKQTASEQVFSATRTVLHHILGTLKADAIDKTYRV